MISRINAYQIMWLFVFFDLPTQTKTDRKKAAGFRKVLLKDGFVMMQFSVYIRYCASGEVADLHTRRIRSMVPDRGQVSILRVTDKQYGKIHNFWGGRSTPPAHQAMPQLELF